MGYWATDAKPFVLENANQFHPGPPPDLKSDIWARDYNEIKEIGEKFSTKRTPQQTETAKALAGGWPDRLQPMGTPDRDCQEYVGDRYGAVYGIGYHGRG